VSTEVTKAGGEEANHVVFVQIPALLLPRTLEIEEFNLVRDTKRVHVEVVHSTEVCLGLASNKPDTVWLSTIADLSIIPVAVDIIVKGELFVLLYIPFGENAHAQSIMYHPLGNVTVWIAAMIRKSADITFLSRVDELVLLQHHKVKMLDAVVGVVAHTFQKGGLANHLAYVFVDEVVSAP
jgi:hypothetical protein